MPTALYSIYATVDLHVTVPHMPVLELYESLTKKLIKTSVQSGVILNLNVRMEMVYLP